MSNWTIKKVSKPYRNKWPYRIAVGVDGHAWYIAKHSTAECIGYFERWISSWETIGANPNISPESRANLDYQIKTAREVMAIAQAIDPYRDHIGTRSNLSRLELMTTDESVFNNLCTLLDERIEAAYAPEEGFARQSMQDDMQIILCDKLPFNKYEFRVTIRTSKCPNSVRQEMYSWLESCSEDLVKKPRGLMKWLGGYRYPSTNYFYVADENTRLLACLILGDNISRIERYVILPSKAPELTIYNEDDGQTNTTPGD